MYQTHADRSLRNSESLRDCLHSSLPNAAVHLPFSAYHAGRHEKTAGKQVRFAFRVCLATLMAILERPKGVKFPMAYLVRERKVIATIHRRVPVRVQRLIHEYLLSVHLESTEDLRRKSSIDDAQTQMRFQNSSDRYRRLHDRPESRFIVTQKPFSRSLDFLRRRQLVLTIQFRPPLHALGR